MRLTTDSIKSMFKTFFSDPIWVEKRFVYWLNDPMDHDIVQICSDFNIKPDPSGESYIKALVGFWCDPKSWKRCSKSRISNDANEWQQDFMKSVQDFNEFMDDAHVIDIPRFEQHLNDYRCWSRSFILRTELKETVQGTDYELFILSDPEDEHVLGWFIHED